MARRRPSGIPAFLLSLLLLAGCASRAPKPAQSWVTMDSEQRQRRLQLAPSCDSRVIRYNNGQIEFVERRATSPGGLFRDSACIPIVYVHGLGGNMGDFGPQMLAEEPDRTAIALNLPGTGQSTNLRNAYTIQALSEALHEMLQHRMDFRKVDLVCHSLGGQVCIAFALDHPSNVSSLTLIDAAGSYNPAEFAQRMAKRFGKVNLGNVQVDNHPAIAILTGGNQTIVNRLVSEDPLVISALDSFNQNFRNQIRNLSVPVLLIWGEKDPIFPIQNGFFLLSNVKDIRMRVVPNAGHVPQLTDPALVLGWIREFHQLLNEARE